MQIKEKKQKAIGYLSGAPSVSTRPEASASGPRSHILGLIKGFTNLGWNVVPYIVGDHVPDKWIQASTKTIVKKHWTSRLITDLLRIFLGKLSSIIAKHQIKDVDFVYERFGSFQSLGRIFQRKNIKWVLETNGPFFIEAKRERKILFLSRLARKMEMTAYRQCDLLVCVTNQLKEIMVEELKLNHEKILVVPNGVDINFFSPVGIEEKRFFNFPVIGYIGAIIERQRLDLLLKAIAELRNLGKNIGFVALGDGSHKNYLINQSKELNISNQVKFIGKVNRYEVPGFIAGFDLGYSGQDAIGEGLLGRMYHSPLKLYEYLSMGKPAIASAYEDAKRVIKQNETGFLFTPGDIESLTSALRLALDQRENWPHMSKMAREEIIRNHSWENRAEIIITYLQNHNMIS